MHELSLTFHKGHLFVKMDGSDWLLDTGAPTSFGTREIAIANENFTIPENYMGLTAGELSGYVDHLVSGILGADILNGFDVLVDVKNEKVSLTREEISVDGETLEMTDFMGIPIIEVEIGGLDRHMFFDTGAQVSYFQDESLCTFPAIGSIADFYPGFGEFQTETYLVDAGIGATRFELCCGSLPGVLGMTLSMAGVDGIIGNEIISDHVLGYFFRRQKLVIA